MINLVHVLVSSYGQQTAKGVRESIRKSNIFEKIKTRRREKYFNLRKRMLIRFVDFEISNHKGLYVRISVIETTVLVNEWSIYFCTQLRSYYFKLLASKIAL